MTDIGSLKAEYGYWGEHELYTRANWKYGINHNRIQHGYWRWVLMRIESQEVNFPLVFITDSPYSEYDTDADEVGGFRVGQLVYDIHHNTVGQILAFYLNPCIEVRLDSNGMMDIDQIMGLSTGVMNTIDRDSLPKHINKAIDEAVERERDEGL